MGKIIRLAIWGVIIYGAYYGYINYLNVPDEYKDKFVIRKMDCRARLVEITSGTGISNMNIDVFISFIAYNGTDKEQIAEFSYDITSKSSEELTRSFSRVYSFPAGTDESMTKTISLKDSDLPFDPACKNLMVSGSKKMVLID